MRWLNPAAFLGLLTIAVPVFVHLFGRRIAKKQRFPSLRFLQLATPSASSRSQPSDIVLLVVRCAVVIAAALALAQPLWRSPDRQAQSATPSRAIIVDTSASMLRLTTAGSPAIQRARDLARAALDSAREGIVIETATPGANIAAAASWLETRSGHRQLMLISDFQAGGVWGAEVAGIPVGIGFRPIRVDVAGTDTPAVVEPHAGVTMSLRRGSTDATWNVATDTAESPRLALLFSPDDSLHVSASIAAAGSHRNGGGDSVALVFPGYDGYAGLVRQAVRFDQPWQGDFLLALGAQPLIATAEPARGASGCEGPLTTPVRNSRGQVLAAVARRDQSSQVLVFSCARAGSAGGSALLAAVASASSRPTLSEFEPDVVPDELLRQWERPPIAVNPDGVGDTSPDGRWLWLVAIALLLVEEWLRRRVPRGVASAPAIERYQRVA